MTKLVWLWVVAAVVTLAAGVGLAFWVHEHPSWGQPVESAGGAAAALFAAVAGIASAVAAVNSRKTARDAARSLLLHERPVVDPSLSMLDDEIAVLHEHKNPVPRFALATSDQTLRKVVQVTVSWRADGERKVREQTITAEDGLDDWYPLDGLSYTQSAERHLGVKGDFVRIEVVDDRGQPWTTSAIRRGGMLSQHFTPLVLKD